jgi:hypothetical protein
MTVKALPLEAGMTMSSFVARSERLSAKMYGER